MCAGIEGKIAVITYARLNKVPYFGLCYGMQLLVIEYARHVAGLPDAHTTEINKLLNACINYFSGEATTLFLQNEKMEWCFIVDDNLVFL